MKKNQAIAGFSLAALLVTFTFYACTKSQSASMPATASGQQSVSMYLTDGPSDFFAHVYLDIRSVSVLVDTCASDTTAPMDEEDHDHHNGWGNTPSADTCNVWQDLGIQSGVYDVLTLRNGVDSLVAQGTIKSGVIKFIKISLGDSNSVVLNDSTVVPLNFHGWFDSTIYIPVGRDFMDEFAPGHSRCWMDFDIGHSIIPFGNGFWLHPFFRCFTNNTTGGIEGVVLPEDARTVITAYSSTDTATALPWRDDGHFKIRGLQQGTYSLDIKSTNGYVDTTINNISVMTGSSVNLGKITLHK